MSKLKATLAGHIKDISRRFATDQTTSSDALQQAVAVLQITNKKCQGEVY